jgi:hypothetical protein
MPVAVGEELFLSYANEAASGVYSLRPSQTVENKLDPYDTTTNVPGYIPLSPRRMVGNEKHSTLFVLDDGSFTDKGEQQNLYVYTWKYDGGELAHSAWTKWTFNGSDPSGDDYTIMDIFTVGDRLYLIINTDNNICLEYIDLDMSTQDVRLSQGIIDNFTNLCIDRKCTSTTNTNLSNKQDTQSAGEWDQGYLGINFPISTPLYDITSDGTDTVITPKFKLTSKTVENLIIVLDDGTIYDMDTVGEGALSVVLAGQQNVKIGANRNSGTLPKITVSGVNLRSNRHFYLGLKYNMRSRFGPFIPVKGEENLAGRNVFVRSGTLTFSKANQATVSVFQDKEYIHTLDATPSGWERNYIRDPENIQDDPIIYFGDYGENRNKWYARDAYNDDGNTWPLPYRHIPNYTRAPDGTMTADYFAVQLNDIVGGSSTTAERNAYLRQDIIVPRTLNQKYTFSAYIKKTPNSGVGEEGGRQQMAIILYLDDGGTIERMTIYIDLYSGTLKTMTSGSSSLTTYTEDDITVTAVGNDWIRVTGTLIDSSGDAQLFRVSFYPQPQYGDNHLILWGARLDKGATAATHHPQVPNKSGDMMFGLRKFMPDLEYELTNTTPWNSMFQLLNYDLTIQENT